MGSASNFAALGLGGEEAAGGGSRLSEGSGADAVPAAGGASGAPADADPEGGALEGGALEGGA
jgi:hypothetical protein